MKIRASAGSTSADGAAPEDYGLAVINDAKYGYSVKGSELRISIVRSPVYAQFEREMKPGGEYLWQDQGRQTFRMILVPHASGWREAGIVRMAEEFTAPVPVLYQGIHPGSRPGLRFLSFGGCAEHRGLGG